jgi:Uncharacterized bacitracin resistance protein
MHDIAVAIVIGVLQGVIEWLPVSSQGNLAVVLTALGSDPDTAVQLALFLQLGTTLSAASYYRDELRQTVIIAPDWRPDRAFQGQNKLLSFLLVASLCTGLVGIPVYVLAVDVASELAGGVFIAVIGILLVLTGIAQLASESLSLGGRKTPTLSDSVLVGALQGLTILPGVSRSGTTTSVLLFRNYEPPAAFRLSFLLSIPASMGGAALTLAGAGGLPGIGLGPALVALTTSAVIGYIAIDTLLAIVERVPFWAVCFGLGGLAIVGGGAIWLA